jgi:hypothetical protein
MNVEIGTVAAQFLFWEYLLRSFSIASLQCTQENTKYPDYSPLRGAIFTYPYSVTAKIISL